MEAPRGFMIPRLVGSRSIVPKIAGGRPTGAPSAGLLHPPEVLLFSLLVDVREAPELIVHA